MDFLRQWAIGLIICGIGATVISLLSPRGTMEKTLRAVIGIFIVSAVCMPLQKLKNADEVLPAFSFDGEAYFNQNLEKQMLEACRETVGKVIDKTAKDMNIAEYDVDADIQMDANCCIVINLASFLPLCECNETVPPIKMGLDFPSPKWEL